MDQEQPGFLTQVLNKSYEHFVAENNQEAGTFMRCWVPYEVTDAEVRRRAQGLADSGVVIQDKQKRVFEGQLCRRVLIFSDLEPFDFLTQDLGLSIKKTVCWWNSWSQRLEEYDEVSFYSGGPFKSEDRPAQKTEKALCLVAHTIRNIGFVRGVTQNSERLGVLGFQEVENPKTDEGGYYETVDGATFDLFAFYRDLLMDVETLDKDGILALDLDIPEGVLEELIEHSLQSPPASAKNLQALQKAFS